MIKNSYLTLIFILFISLLNIDGFGQRITVDQALKEAAKSRTKTKVDDDAQEKRRLQTFLVVWQTINDNYFDKTFNGLNWNEIKKEYEPKVRKLKTDDELYELLQEMISRLERSHLQIIPPEVYEVVEDVKEQIKGEGNDEEDSDDTDIEEDSEDKTEDEELYAEYGIGVDLRFFDNQFVITGVSEGSSAKKAGLKMGYVLEKINGVSLKEFLELIRKHNNKNAESFEKKIPLQIIEWFLHGEKDTSVTLTVLDETSQTKEITIKREKLNGQLVTVLENAPKEYFNFESKDLTEDVGYIKFNMFALPLVEAFCQAVTKFKGKKALIIDLRGNVGGSFGGLIGISGLLVKRPFNLGTEIYRKGKQPRWISPHAKNFKGKVVILVDENSYSAAELFAAAFQENGRATIIGEKSAGEALPSLTKLLPTGAVFLFPIANFMTPKGNFLEGKGIQPDIKVSLSREALLRGDDSQLNAALRVANQQETAKVKKRGSVRRGPPPPPAKRRRKQNRRPKKVKLRQSTLALRTVEDFLNKIGGREALEKINSYKAKGTAILKSASNVSIEGKGEIYWKSPNKIAEIIKVESIGEVREVFDGKRYFVQSEFAKAERMTSSLVLEDKGLSSGFYELLNIKNLYPSITYKGIFNYGKKRVYVIEAISPKGIKGVFLFDTITKLLLKRTSNFLPEVVYEKYKKVGDVKLPFVVGKGNNLVYEFNKIEINPTIDDSVFTLKEKCFDKVN